MRALAQRSADAAKQIKALIAASTSEVAHGVKHVGETGVSLVKILKQVDEINTVVTDIAASAREQATALHEVNAAVTEMDQAIQQNAAMAEQATAASQSLAQESEELAKAIAQFKVRHGADSLRGVTSPNVTPATEWQSRRKA